MKKLLMAFAILCSVPVLSAEPDFYAALCAWAPGQIPMSSGSVIWGVRGTLFYGDHSRLNGFDLALLGANRTREQFNGFAIATVFNRANTAAGAQISRVNFVENEFYGLQIADIFNYASFVDGVQVGGVNIAWNEMCGLQCGAWWNHAGFGYGSQWGIVNTAGYFAGLQVGLFNWADDLDGLQLGLINVIADQAICVFPFLNIGF